MRPSARRNGLAIALAVFASVWLAERAGLLQGAELALYDRWIAAGAASEASADPVVVLVEITEADIARFGHPIPDARLAEALRVLSSTAPRAVGVDLYRDRPVGEGAAALRAAITGNARIVVVEKLPDAAGPGVAAPAFVSPAQVGFSDMALDGDGTVRRMFLYLWDAADASHLSLALQLSLRFLRPEGVGVEPADSGQVRMGSVVLPPFEPDDGGYVGADAGGYQLLLDFAAGASGFPTFSFGALLDGEIGADAFAGRVVVVGTSAPSVKDLLATPLAGSGSPHLTGMAVHAHAVDQLVRHGRGVTRPRRVWPAAGEAAWMALFALAGVAVAGRLRSTSAGIAAVLALPLVAIGVAFVAHGAGWWIPAVPASLASLAAAGLGVAASLTRERAEKTQLAQLFGRHVSPEVFDRIWEQRDAFMDGGRPLPQRLEATVLLADLSGFGEAADTLEPSALMDWLNTCTGAMARAVEAHGGVVEDYAGDGMKANFGVPVATDRAASVQADARAAIRAALAMGQALVPLNAELEGRGQPPARLRVGIETGPVVVGSLGSDDHLKYTTVGDTVVTAARLESFDREGFARDPEEPNFRVLVGEVCAQHLDGACETERLGQTVLKGKRAATSVYRVRGVVDGVAGVAGNGGT